MSLVHHFLLSSYFFQILTPWATHELAQIILTIGNKPHSGLCVLGLKKISHLIFWLVDAFPGWADGLMSIWSVIFAEGWALGNSGCVIILETTLKVGLFIFLKFLILEQVFQWDRNSHFKVENTFPWDFGFGVGFFMSESADPGTERLFFRDLWLIFPP